MLLALDIGNTTITVGRISNRDVADTWRLPIAVADLEQAVGELVPLDRVTAAVVASVVPAVSLDATRLFARIDVPVLIADWQTIPLPTRVARPSEVGADRLVNSFAALRLYGAPAIVVDLGTATTFDVVDATGHFVGGAIAPGIGLGADALASRAALLPRIELALPRHAIGPDTVSAMQSGIVIGYIGLVRELVATITAELSGTRGVRPKVILTGGFSNADWADEIHADEIDPDLTLRGLAILHAEVPAPAPETQATA